MKQSREIFITAFALFSLFFGAGNLILPPLLGFQARAFWWLVTLGFSISAVIIPILGIRAHAHLQGTMFDFGKKVSPTFSWVYCVLVYLISISLPSPRTASVTHEMAIQPFFDTSHLVTSIVYFTLVFLFVVNRSKILNVVGKLLTPSILLILLGIILTALFSDNEPLLPSTLPQIFSHGILEGYQTFDAIGAVVVGGVIIISINLKNKNMAYAEKKKLIAQAGWIAGGGLFLIYAGLILSGALLQGHFEDGVTRTDLLQGISMITLGSKASLFLGILVALACFTTAVGIVTGTADFAKHLFKGSRQAYMATAILGCLLGVAVGQFNVAFIIKAAIPVLMFIYPITIVLILLNVVPENYASTQVFKIVVAVTVLFSIPDFLGAIGMTTSFFDWIPLRQYHMGWLLPGLLAFVLANLKKEIGIPE